MQRAVCEVISYEVDHSPEQSDIFSLIVCPQCKCPSSHCHRNSSINNNNRPGWKVFQHRLRALCCTPTGVDGPPPIRLAPTKVQPVPVALLVNPSSNMLVQTKCSCWVTLMPLGVAWKDWRKVCIQMSVGMRVLWLCADTLDAFYSSSPPFFLSIRIDQPH